ncbi:mitochondrial carrier domain-containing protein [Zopfochytrium polystomum]|nr:mitochondrial carrier domain-containing protein [Zopfochytrium polystomum]
MPAAAAAAPAASAPPKARSASSSSSSSTQTAKELLAGSIGGIVQVLSGQPFDTVKVRLQTQAGQYTSALDCVRKTYRNEGIAGFYKGTLTPLLGIGACVSIQFAALESAKRWFARRNAAASAASAAVPGGSPSSAASASSTPWLSTSQLFAAGAVSGVANSVLSGPIEHVRIRLQVQSGAPGATAYSGPVDFAKKVVARHGLFRGLYKGQWITLLREAAGYGVYFCTYESLVQSRMRAMGTTRRDAVETWRQCVYGAASGYTLWLVIYPVDAIKSKIQTDGFDAATRKYSSSFDCARKTFAAEGLAGFYRGFGTCLLRAGPVNAVTFVAYEVAMNVLGR